MHIVFFISAWTPTIDSIELYSDELTGSSTAVSVMSTCSPPCVTRALFPSCTIFFTIFSMEQCTIFFTIFSMEQCTTFFTIFSMEQLVHYLLHNLLISHLLYWAVHYLVHNLFISHLLYGAMHYLLHNLLYMEQCSIFFTIFSSPPVQSTSPVQWL